jgi:type IV pilus biogenesis/stability protein PilW
MKTVRRRRFVWWIVLVFQTYVLTGCAPSQRFHLEADEHYRVAQQYFGNSSYLLAEQEVRKALDLDPHDPRYFELLALIYQAQGRLKPADEAYRTALQQPNVPPSVLVNYSTVLLLRDRYDEAIGMARRALENPGYDKPAIAYTNIGLAYLKKGEPRQAVENLRSALEYDPSLPEAHHNLGLAYARVGERTLAIRSFREAIRYRPSYAQAYAELGQVLLAEGRQTEARAAFERVVTLDPDSALAVAARQQLQRLNP